MRFLPQLVKFVGFSTFFALASFASEGAKEKSANDKGTPKYEIASFRFRNQAGKTFERLVLEFTLKEEGKKQPSVNVKQETGESEATVTLSNLGLIGAIPEASINDSYTGKSKYMGPITVNTEVASGLSLKVELKDVGAQVKPLWLNNPPRLVIDAYGGANADKIAEREEGHARRGLASHGRKNSEPESYFCFPANTQVGLSVVFQPRHRSSQEIPKVQVDLDAPQSVAVNDPNSDAIVCYPSSAQVMPSITFNEAPVAGGHANAAPKNNAHPGFSNWAPAEKNAPTESASHPKSPKHPATGRVPSGAATKSHHPDSKSDGDEAATSIQLPATPESHEKPAFPSQLLPPLK